MPVGYTLQSALAACLNALPDAVQTRLPLRTGHAEVRHRHDRPQDVRLHIAAWTDNEAMSTVPDVPIGAVADLSSEPAGQDWDYLDGDGMVLVSANHYLSMSSGLHQKTIEQYVRSLLGDHGQQGETLFALYPVADQEVVRRVRRQGGVKKIDLNIGQYMETARHETDHERKTIVEKLGRDVILDLIAEDDDRADILAADNVSARLIISLDRRRPGITPEDLTGLTEQIAAESEEDIEIETASGHRVKRGELILKKAVDVDAFARTVHHQHAWELMEEYLRELRQSGMLAE